jgi:hypothetical protein
MRKLTLFVVALFVANMSFAQKGLEFGLSFTPASPWILNDEDFAEGDDLNYRGTFGFNTGLTLGYNFTDAVGFHTGVQFSRQGQNYINYNSAPEKADMDVFSRKLSYVRIPFLLKFNGDPTASSSSYFRIGPHLDLLNSAKYAYTNKSGSGLDQSVDLRSLYEVNQLTGQTQTNRLKMYKGLVVGLTLEMGGAVNMTEALKLVFMLHMSGSLSKTEDIEAAIGGNQLARSVVEILGLPVGTVANGNPNPFPSSVGGNRSSSWNVMGGFTVGFHYVLAFE